MHTNTEFLVRMHVVLEPVAQPWTEIAVGPHSHTQPLQRTQRFDFEFTANGHSTISITHFDKHHNDPVTAVIVKEIGFFGITDPRFVWAGMYRPNYPPHLVGDACISGQAYLGWNGIYQLRFDVPVFKWIHKTLNMGWLYD